MCRSNLSSETSSFVNVIKENGYSIVEMNRKPVNSLGLELLTELVNVIDDLEADPACQGLILTSVSYKDVLHLQKCNYRQQFFAYNKFFVVIANCTLILK